MTTLEKNIRKQLEWGWQMVGFELYKAAKAHALVAVTSLKSDGHNLSGRVRRELQESADRLYSLTTSPVYYR